MNKNVKEKIKTELRKNEPISDLTEIVLDTETTNYVLKELKQNHNIGLLKLNEKSSIDFRSQIEAQLLRNNKNYRQFPTDHVHCLLCSHCLETEFTEVDKFSDDFQFPLLKYKLLNEQEWKVHDVFQSSGYKSVLYSNRKTRNLVLAFQGVKLDVVHFFKNNGNEISSVVYSMLANQDIAPQTIHSYLHTQSAVDLCRDNKSGYSLSFTGYGFGAWLAEQAVYFASQDFNYHDAKTVTFDSPGSLDYLKMLNETNLITKFDLRSLNIVNYLSAPNFLNTCNRHVGKVYRLFTDSKRLFDADKFSDRLIKKVPSKAQKKIRACYEKNVKSSLIRYAFYINGFKSIFNDGLQLILNEFDPASGKPFRFKSIEKWPLIVFSPSDDFKKNFSKIFDSGFIIENMLLGCMVPKGVKTLIAKGVNMLTGPLVSTAQNNISNGVIAIINFIIEIISGKLNSNQCLSYFEYDENKLEFSKEKKQVLNSTNFLLSYEAHYKCSDVYLKQDELAILNHGSVDQLLFKLKRYTENKSDLKALNNSFIEKQLIKLKSLYRLEPDGKNMLIVGDKDIELIRFRLARLLMLHDDLKEFLDRLDVPKLNPSAEDLIELESVIDRNVKPYFTGRENELKQINELLDQKQYVYIYGLSGSGKSEIALKLAINLKETQGYIVFQIEYSSLLLRFNHLAEVLKIEKQKNPDEMFHRLKPKLNQYTKSNGSKILFLVTDLVQDDPSSRDELDNFKYLTVGFNKNIKFLITTIHPEIDDKLADDLKSKFEIKTFNLNASLEFIDLAYNKEAAKRKKNLTTDEWKEIINTLSSSQTILPVDLEKLVSAIKQKGKTWKSDDIVKYIKNEMKNDYCEMKNSKPHAYSILSYMAYLNKSCIQTELIEYLMLQFNTTMSREAYEENIEYLEKCSEIKLTERGYNIHGTTISKILNEHEKSENESEIKLIVSRIVTALNEFIKEEDIEKELLSLNDDLNEYFNHSIKILSSKWLEKNETCSQLLYKIGKIYEKILLKSKTALSCYQKCLEIQKSVYGTSDSLEMANTLMGIGNVLDDLNKSDEAIDYLKQSLEIRRRVYGTEEHAKIGGILNNIGAVLFNQGNYEEALEFYKQSLEIKRKCYDTDEHHDIANTLNNIGAVFFRQDLIDQAVEYYTKSLNIKRKVYGTDEHPVVANTLHNIGIVLDHKQDYEESLGYYEESLEIYKKVYGNSMDHLDIAKALKSIGNVLYLKGYYEEALKNYEQSLEIERKVYDTDESPLVASSLMGIGNVMKKLVKYDDALKHFNDALLIRRKIYKTENHPSVIRTRSSIRSVLKYQGKSEDDYNFS